MPNTKTKKFDFQIFLAVFLILLVICCATVCVVLSNNENGVAYAYNVILGDDGIVGSNIIYNSDFSINTSSSTSWSSRAKSVLTVDGWYLFNGDVTYTDSMPRINFDSTQVGKVYSRFYSESFSLSPGTYTVSACYNYLSGGGTSRFRIINSDLTSFDSSFSGSSYVDLTRSPGVRVSSFTFTISSPLSSIVVDYYSSAPSAGFIADLYWVKLEEGSSFTGYVPNYEELQNQNTQLQEEIDRLNGIIQQQRQEIHYYEALIPQTETVAVFDISKCVPSTFVYNGVTYSSDTIKAIDGGGWNVYDSRYKDKQLPTNQSVGFSLLLTETLNNTKIHINPNIQPWYHYTYCSEPNEQGESQCFDHLVKHLSFSVGYRNQNGQVVKLGDVSPDLVGNTDFIINQPTNEIVFFAPECNRLEIGKGMGAFYYKVNTQVLYDKGYNLGFNHGMARGKGIGFREGVASASDYSFFSLFSAVFDAPITAIVGRWGDSDGDGVYEREGGMLNFYIPGLDINFAPFLLSIFTLAIIVMIIRFVLARKS